MWSGPLRRIDNFRWKIPEDYVSDAMRRAGVRMRVPGMIYATEKMKRQIVRDNAPEQVANVATLPGIVRVSMAMPDIHWGYGFPIGGVAAFDGEEGVVSPGGVGYDINCLSPDTKILTENGYWVELKELPKKIYDENVRIYNADEGHNDSSLISFVSERPIAPEETAIRIITESGRVIEGSEDHPVLTPEGYKPLGDITGEDMVLIYPFEGVRYEEREGVIIDEDSFKNEDYQIVKYLKERGLIPLRWSDPKAGVIARILGFGFGDGHLGEMSGRITISFFGRESTLTHLKKDIEKLGMKCAIYSREREYRIETVSGWFEGRSRSAELRVSSRSFAVLLEKLGMPKGNKSKIEYGVPEWIMESPLWIKRNFLAGLFGADGSIVGFKKNTPLPINLTQGKSEELRENLIEFLNCVALMLSEFGIKTTIYEVKSRKGVTYRLSVVGEESIRKFLGMINYEYDLEKKERGLLAYAYLLFKRRVKEERKLAADSAREVYKESKSVMKAYDSVKHVVNKRFVERAVYNGMDNPRLPGGFPSFERFASDRGFPGGFAAERIEKIERIKPDYAKFYDLGVVHDAHNFIANGIVVHNCGVRLLRTDLTVEDVRPKIREVVDTLFANIPSGVGAKGRLRLTVGELNEVLDRGAKWAVEHGYGWQEDLERIEENGGMKSADSSKVSHKAKSRGLPQLGTLGAGNHFLEVQVVEKVYIPEIAKKFGITGEGQITVMIHTGSRGLGHQVATDYIRVMEEALRKYGIRVPDMQLACAPAGSREVEDYFGAMCAAANYAFTNRQLITHWVRESFRKVFEADPEDLGMEVVYDVAHNIAKYEEHVVDGKRRRLYVHRKGATRAFPAGRPELSGVYRDVGQPVLIPGDMGTASYVLVGTDRALEETFGSTCHGAGRVLSRAAAKRRFWGRDVQKKLMSEGIYLRAADMRVVAEEAPDAYKDVGDVVEAVEGAGISRIVAKLRPIGVVKG